MILNPETYLVKAFKKDGSFDYRSVEVPINGKEFVQIYPDTTYHTKKEVDDRVGFLCYDNGYSSYIIEGKLKYSFINEKN